MNGQGSARSGLIQRGLLLQQQRRFTEAENVFRDILARNPNDAYALMQLASCQLHIPRRERDALQSINQAIALQPNEAVYHGMKAYILCTLHRPEEALISANAGLELDPSSCYVFTSRAQALLVMEKWSLAETAARQALALDADNANAANQLAHALRLQNKMDENATQIAGMLARDPEDARTHCSAGWSALQLGDRKTAEQHFLEALRLEPGYESARHGLLNSFRARSPLYRAYLAYCFRMQKVGRQARFAVIVGAVIAVNFFRALFTGPMAPVAFGIAVLYFLFVLWVWVAKGVGNFILLFDRFARHALLQSEKIEALFVGGGIGAGLILLGAGFAFRQEGLYMPAATLIASAFPLSMTFTNPSLPGRVIFGGIGAFCLVTCAALLCNNVFQLDSAMQGTLQSMLTFSIMGAVLSTWLGNVPELRRRKP